MSKERVSIIIPTYNRLELLSQTLLSVRNQSYTDWVAYICDDGSQEDVQAILRSVSDKRFVYQRLEHRGIGCTRNRGLEMVKSTYVVMLDSDDVWHPDFLETTVSFLEQNPQVDMVQTAQGIIDYHSNYAGRRNALLDESVAKGQFGNGHYVSQNALHYFLKESYGQNNFSSLLLRAELAKSVKMEEITFMEDWDYWVKLGKTGAVIAYLDEELCLYRAYERQVNISKQISSLYATIQMLRQHKFVELWQRAVQKTIIGNLYEMIGFDYLTIGEPRRAAPVFLASIGFGVSTRRLYGLSRCIAPKLTEGLKTSFAKNRRFHNL